MVRTLIRVAIFAGAALTKPLVLPKANPDVYLTARQEPASNDSATAVADGEAPAPTLQQNALVEGAAVEGETSARDSDFLKTWIPSTCSVTITQGSLTYTNYPEGGASGVPTTTTFSSSIMCKCDTGDTATLPLQVQGSSIRGSDGATSYYCNALGKWETSPVSISVPTGTPGEADNEAWAKVSCSYGSLISGLNDPWEQWNDSSAAAAYADAVEAFSLDDKGVGFGDFLPDYFNMRPATDCEKVNNPNCGITFNCGSAADGPNYVVNSPAGYMILNSVIALHAQLDALYNGIRDAKIDADGYLDKVVNTYSPINKDIKDQKDTKLALDGLQMGLTAAMAPTFHGVLATTPWVKRHGQIFGTGIDVSYGFLGATMAFIKDAMESLSTAPIQAEISSYMTDTIRNWRDAIGNGTKDLFNDHDAVFKAIDRGIAFPIGDLPTASPGLEDNLLRIMLASVLPSIWATGASKPIATIITSDGLDQDGEGCESYKLDSFKQTQSDSVRNGLRARGLSQMNSDARICDDQGKAYWLVAVTSTEGSATCPGGGVKRDPQGQAPQQNGVCTYKDLGFDLPYGVESLDGSGPGKLTRNDIVFNAVNSWVRNGHKNGWTSLDYDYTSQSDLDALNDGDMSKLSGIVKIPVCSVKEIVDTVWDDSTNSKGNGNFPCPA